jgi:outer membrane biosynthesis protein TonB
MQLTHQEDIRNKSFSALLTLLIVSLLLLFLFLFQLITPNPPFPESGGGGGMEMALGMMDVGNDVIDYKHMGAAPSVIVSEEPAKKEDLLTDENSEVAINEEKKKDPEKPITEVKPEVKNNTVVIKPVVKEKTMAEKLAEKYKNQSGKSGGGVGNNEMSGQQGSPDGNPGGTGTGGSGGGSGGGTGTGIGPGSGPGSGPGHGSGYKFTLDGRSVIKPPTLPKDTKEEGKVVVNIVVDSEGNVIEADPNGRGTTTSSALLKAKARQAAMATKFNIDGKMGEQRGTITIIFAFD